MIFDILLILALIVLNGFFALSEIAIVTSKKGRLEHWAEEGRKGAQTALDLTSKPNQFLSSIQVGITLIGIIAGAYAGANLAQPVYEWFKDVDFLTGYSWEAAYIIVVAVVTYFTLVIGELVPKRLALHNPEKFAVKVAGTMLIISKVATPLIWFLSRSMKVIFKLTGSGKDSDEPSVTTHEIRGMMAEGIEEGTVEKEEYEIVTRLFQFGDQDVASVMTPRREIAGIDLDATNEEQKQMLLAIDHTLAVAYNENMDNAVGTIHVRSVLVHLLQNATFNLADNVRNVQFVSENTSALQVLKYFRRTGQKMALIVDEYGGVEGLVTLDDILEALVGDIPWVGDTLEPDLLKIDDETWIIEGKVTVEHLKDSLHLSKLSNDEQEDFRTVGGWATHHFNEIPDIGDRFEWESYAFEVLSMDNSRVEKIKATLLDNHDLDETE